jgi:DNA-binding HxlR family transcriptional regulator
VILFHLFGGKTLRFSDLERAIDGISQKMLSQQLRQLENDRIITRIVHAEVPPKVEYHLTEWGQSLCPALDRLLTWAEHQPSSERRVEAENTADLRDAQVALTEATQEGTVPLETVLRKYGLDHLLAEPAHRTGQPRAVRTRVSAKPSRKTQRRRR